MCTIKCPEIINIVHCTECPADFTHISSVNGCYKVVNRNLAWAAAGLECRSLHKDAHLLIINDAVEQLVVAGMLASANRQCLLHVLFYYFNNVYISVFIQRYFCLF